MRAAIQVTALIQIVDLIQDVIGRNIAVFTPARMIDIAKSVLDVRRARNSDLPAE